MSGVLYAGDVKLVLALGCLTLVVSPELLTCSFSFLVLDVHVAAGLPSGVGVAVWAFGSHVVP